MWKVSRIFPVLLFMSGLAMGAEVDLDLPKEIPDEPFEITAARIEYTNETMIASGGVTGRFENATIRADHISGNTETGDLHAEGDIHFERDNVIWQGTELNYNYFSQSGDFGPSSLNFDPVLMSVDHVERVSTNKFLLRDAEFTTCPKDHPHFHVRAKEAELVDEKYLKAKGVTVYFGSVPVFYVPYWRQKLSRSIFTFGAGYGSEWGAYGLIKATVPVTEHVDWITDLNLYSKRGVGFGQGAEWNFPNAVGEFSAFYLKDEDPYSKFDLASSDLEEAAIASEIGDDRYRFKLEHLQHLNSETHYINTKLNYLSDPAVLEEFFKSEYRNYAQPENYASWVYGNRYIGTEGFASYRLNDFYSNIDRAEYSLDLYRTRIPGTPFYFQSENSIASLEQKVSTIDLTGAAYDSARLDSDNTVFLPQRWGFLSLVPRAGYRATYYSDTVVGGEETRHIPSAGMEASLQATKVLSERERWYGKGLRHKVEPYADYIFEESSISSATNDLYQFDSVDTLDDENKVKLGLRNVLQTKRGDHVSRFIELDLFTHYLVDKQGGSDNFDSLFIDVRAPLTTRAMLDVEGVCNWNNGEIPFFNTRFSYDWDELILSLEHLYREDLNNLWTPRFDLFPKGNWSLEGYVRYEGDTNEWEEIAAATYLNWCCMRYGLGAHFYDDNEVSVMFSIGLSAFPEARISSSF